MPPLNETKTYRCLAFALQQAEAVMLAAVKAYCWPKTEAKERLQSMAEGGCVAVSPNGVGVGSLNETPLSLHQYPNACLRSS